MLQSECPAQFLHYSLGCETCHDTHQWWRASFAKSDFAHHVAFSSDFLCGSFALVGGNADDHGFQSDLGPDQRDFSMGDLLRKIILIHDSRMLVTGSFGLLICCPGCVCSECLLARLFNRLSKLGLEHNPSMCISIYPLEGPSYSDASSDFFKSEIHNTSEIVPH
jgi:hypothetical protein